MRYIESAENRIYRLCVSLARRKYRDEYGMYIVEGPNIIADARKRGIAPEYVIAGARAAEDPEIAGLLDEDSVIMSDRLFSNASRTENSQGIFAVLRKEAVRGDSRESIDGFLDSVSPGRDILVLDRVQDPGNAGTMIRTADAAGFGAVICLKGTGDIYEPKAARAAAGSLFRVPALERADAALAYGALKDRGYTVFAAHPSAGDAYYDVDMRSYAAVVIGNEGNGISGATELAADRFVTIPMNGDIDSLNAAVAAAVIMFGVIRN